MSDGKLNRLAGDWMIDGYIQTNSPKHVFVYVRNGQAWAVENPAHLAASDFFRGEPPLEVSADGNLLWPSSEFAPNTGELDRVGIVVPCAV